MQLFVGLEAIGEADDKGMRTVMTILNGQLRPVFVRDRSIAVEVTSAEKADASKPGQVAAPFSGVVTLKVAGGRRRSTAGQPVASIEAMKMEAAITATVAGTVERLAIPATQQVEAGDLLGGTIQSDASLCPANRQAVELRTSHQDEAVP